MTLETKKMLVSAATAYANIENRISELEQFVEEQRKKLIEAQNDIASSVAWAVECEENTAHWWLGQYGLNQPANGKGSGSNDVQSPEEFLQEISEENA